MADRFSGWKTPDGIKSLSISAICVSTRKPISDPRRDAVSAVGDIDEQGISESGSSADPGGGVSLF
jgi:hypothetical protein